MFWTRIAADRSISNTVFGFYKLTISRAYCEGGTCHFGRCKAELSRLKAGRSSWTARPNLTSSRFTYPKRWNWGWLATCWDSHKSGLQTQPWTGFRKTGEIKRKITTKQGVWHLPKIYKAWKWHREERRESPAIVREMKESRRPTFWQERDDPSLSKSESFHVSWTTRDFDSTDQPCSEVSTFYEYIA